MRSWVRAFAKKWGGDNVPRLAAATSFYATISLAPLLVLAVAIAAAFFGSELDARQQLTLQVGKAAGTDVALFLDSLISRSHQKSASIWATIVSLSLTFWGASSMFLQVSDSLYSIWKMRQKGNIVQNFVISRMLSFILVVGFGGMVVGWLVMESWLSSVGVSTIGWRLTRWVSFIAATGFFTLTFSAIYRAIPSGQTQWKDVWKGGLFAAIGLTFSKFILGLYFTWVKVSVAYGSAGTLVVVLLWIYYGSLVFYAGAEIVYLATHSESQIDALDTATQKLSEPDQDQK